MPDKQLTWRIDGLDEGVARVEVDGERMITLPADLLPTGSAEGQVLRVARSAGKGRVVLTITLDPAGTNAELERSRKQTSATLAESRKRDPGGNVSL